METGDDEGDAGLVVMFSKSKGFHADVKLALMKKGEKFGCLSIKGRGFADFGFFERGGGWSRNRRRRSWLSSGSFILKGGEAFAEELILIAEGLDLITEGGKGFSLCHNVMEWKAVRASTWGNRNRVPFHHTPACV